MTVSERDKAAQELRAKGLKYREIGERLGIPVDTAWKACNREAAREQSSKWKRRNRPRVRAYDREYNDRYRAVCPKCGHIYGRSSGTHHGPAPRIDFSNCPNCKRIRAAQIVEWWRDGLTLKEISHRLGWTIGHLADEFDRLRAEGYDLPYRNRHERNAPKFPHLQKAA